MLSAYCTVINPLNAELNPICHLLALLGVHHFLHVGRIRVNLDALLSWIPYKIKSTLLSKTFQKLPNIYLPTYLLHGAKSFLRS
jgi:hypothetical protein